MPPKSPATKNSVLVWKDVDNLLKKFDHVKTSLPKLWYFSVSLIFDPSSCKLLDLIGQKMQLNQQHWFVGDFKRGHQMIECKPEVPEMKSVFLSENSKYSAKNCWFQKKGEGQSAVLRDPLRGFWRETYYFRIKTYFVIGLLWLHGL